MMWNNSKRGCEVCSVQYSTSSRDINVILGIGLRDIQHRTEGRGLDCSGFRCLCVMGMASVSWFYLFNIQVRANCTTACNIQAALQYVELTRVSRFFLFVCLQKCACSLERVPKSCCPSPLRVGGAFRPDGG